MTVLVHTEEKNSKDVEEKTKSFIDNVRHKFHGFELKLGSSYIDPVEKFVPSYVKKAILLPS